MTNNAYQLGSHIEPWHRRLGRSSLQPPHSCSLPPERTTRGAIPLRMLFTFKSKRTFLPKSSGLKWYFNNDGDKGYSDKKVYYCCLQIMNLTAHVLTNIYLWGLLIEVVLGWLCGMVVLSGSCRCLYWNRKSTLSLSEKEYLSTNRWQQQHQGSRVQSNYEVSRERVMMKHRWEMNPTVVCSDWGVWGAGPTFILPLILRGCILLIQALRLGWLTHTGSGFIHNGLIHTGFLLWHNYDTQIIYEHRYTQCTIILKHALKYSDTE